MYTVDGLDLHMMPGYGRIQKLKNYWTLTIHHCLQITTY
nr:unnamed protein product [Callosobruchus analis]